MSSTAIRNLINNSIDKPIVEAKNQLKKESSRRQRQHELLIALIMQQNELELMDPEGPRIDSNSREANDPARWLDRNRRVLAKYQSLVNSSIALDALLDSEGIKSD